MLNLTLNGVDRKELSLKGPWEDLQMTNGSKIKQNSHQMCSQNSYQEELLFHTYSRMSSFSCSATVLTDLIYLQGYISQTFRASWAMHTSGRYLMEGQ